MLSAVDEGKDPKLGRDYFWTLLLLAQYPSRVPHGTPSVLLSQPMYTPAEAHVRAEREEHAIGPLLRMAHNDLQPFATYKLQVLLREVGWRVFDNGQGTAVLVPHWRKNAVNQHNYKSKVHGEDYFLWGDEGLIDHLVVSP